MVYLPQKLHEHLKLQGIARSLIHASSYYGLIPWQLYATALKCWGWGMGMSLLHTYMYTFTLIQNSRVLSTTSIPILQVHDH